MPRITSIQARKGTSTEWSTQNPVLDNGELGYDTTNRILKLGDGSTAWNSLSNHSHTSSDISNFNTAVSGLLPVTNIVAGTNVTVSSSAGTYTINSTGGSSSSVVAGSGIVVTSVGSAYTVNLDAYSILIGNGSATSYTVTHNLGATNDVHVSVRDVGTNYYVYPDIKYIDSNSCLIEFNSAPTSNQYRVSIIGF